MSQDGEETEISESGVQALIDRLKDQGVAAGKQEGERIIADAEKRAEWLLKQAKEEAEKTIAAAKKEANFIEQSGRDALAMAVRDSQLFLNNHLIGAFAAQINKLVSKAMQQDDILQQMILEIAHQARPADKAVKILLGESATSAAPLSNDASEALIAFVSHHAKELFEQGVEVKVGNNPKAAMRIVLKDENAEVELSDATVSELILQHVQPRFRTLLEGLMS